MDYVRLSRNLHVHYVRLSRNLYVHYVRLRPTYFQTVLEIYLLFRILSRVWVVQPLREGGCLASLRMFVLLKIFLLLILPVYFCHKFPILATLSLRLTDFFEGRKTFPEISCLCKIALLWHIFIFHFHCTFSDQPDSRLSIKAS